LHQHKPQQIMNNTQEKVTTFESEEEEEEEEEEERQQEIVELPGTMPKQLSDIELDCLTETEMQTYSETQGLKNILKYRKI
jgi:CO dehydrogenase/acetyl-CoA synthase beta subunit